MLDETRPESHGGSPAAIAATTFTLDTDIATDVDDLLAIAMVLGSPELEIAGVATVYGDVELRARVAARAFEVAGVPAPPIAAGLAETLSGREVWWPGHEGSTLADLDAQAYDGPEDAVEMLASSGVVAAIAPLTNVAAAVGRADHAVREIVMMGGDFSALIGRPARVEHNIRCDVAAADAVFRSDVPVLAAGLEQTERIRVTGDDLARIAAAGPLGSLLAAETRRFWQFTGDDFNVPHDPLAVLVLARPELFDLARGRVDVVVGGENDGLTRFTPDPDGPHRIITDYDTAAAAHEIVERILTACRASVRPPS